MTNVEVFRESRMTAETVLEVGADHVAIATGATWRRDVFDGKTYVDVTSDGATVFTPDDIMDGRLPDGPTLVFDGDNYYMAGVIAEAVARAGHPVTYVTEEDSVSAWAEKTSERWRVRTHLLSLGVKIITGHRLTEFDGKTATLECAYSEEEAVIDVSAVVLVTQRTPNDQLYNDILATVDGDATRLPFTLTRIGDVDAPAIIAAAVYAGHRYGEELEEIVDIDEPMKHDRPDVGAVLAATGESEKPADYFATLTAYYEEEISGEAWYAALADLFDGARADKMRLLAAVERHTADIVRPLIEKHGLAVRDPEGLKEEGRTAAARWAGDWDGLLAYMTRTFPGYVTQFRQLEGMGPPADRPMLRRMTEHEEVAIDFLAARGPRAVRQHRTARGLPRGSRRPESCLKHGSHSPRAPRAWPRASGPTRQITRRTARRSRGT